MPPGLSGGEELLDVSQDDDRPVDCAGHLDPIAT
jgi:hypothetical protein